MYASKPNYGSRVTRDNLLRDAPTKPKLQEPRYKKFATWNALHKQRLDYLLSIHNRQGCSPRIGQRYTGKYCFLVKGSSPSWYSQAALFEYAWNCDITGISILTRFYH